MYSASLKHYSLTPTFILLPIICLEQNKNNIIVGIKTINAASSCLGSVQYLVVLYSCNATVAIEPFFKYRKGPIKSFHEDVNTNTVIVDIIGLLSGIIILVKIPMLVQPSSLADSMYEFGILSK